MLCKRVSSKPCIRSLQALTVVFKSDSQSVFELTNRVKSLWVFPAFGQTEKAALKAAVVSMQVALPVASVHSRYHSRFYKNM